MGPAAILSVLVQAKGVRDVTRDLGKVDKAGRNAGAGMAKFQKVAGAGILAVGAAAAVTGPKLIDLASDAEETASKFKIVFGKETQAAIKQLDEFSKATGTSKFALREQAAQLQALIKPMGVAGKASSKMSTDLTKLATDLASFNNSSVEEAITALQSGLVGEAEPLRKFGVQLSENRVKAFAYAEGIAKQGKELTTAEKAQARYGIILKDTKLAQGDAVRTSDSFANQLKRLKSNVTDAATELGVKLLPAATDAVGAITKFIDQMRNGEGVGGRLVAVVKGIVDVVKRVVTGFREGEPAARVFISTMAGAASAFVAWRVLSSVAAGITAVKKAWEAATFAFTKNPVGLVLAAFSAIAGALAIFSVNTDDATASTRELTDAFRAQHDAMRALRDIDIDVAQRKANMKSANVAVEQAEKRLHDVRKDSHATSLDIKQAEADLTQAKVNARRASRELNRAEEDGKRVREDASRATEDANKKLQGSIDKKKKDYDSTTNQIRATEQQIDVLKRQGFNTDRLRDKVNELRDRQQALRKEIDKLEDKKITVAVKIDIPGSTPSSPRNRLGDGWGVEDGIRSLMAKADPMSLLGGLGGAPVSGSGLNAFNAIASRFGLTIGSGFRPGSITSSGNLSYHAMGRARDFPGSPGQMMAFAQFMAATYGSRLKELIYTPLGFSIKNGARVAPYAQADHYDHVHVAMRRGGKVPGAGPGDKVPAMLEPGEFVMQKKIVDMFGPTFFASMNGMKKGGKVKKRGTKRERLESAFALAELTPRLSDDIKRADALVAYWERRLKQARKSKAPHARIAEFAQNLRSARDTRRALNPEPPSTDDGGGAVDSGESQLAAAIEENNRLIAEQNTLNEQIKTNQLKVLALAGQGDQIVAAVVAAVNGGIGGRVGLGFHGIRSTPGSVANL